MHIPDGFLSPSVILTTYILVLIFWAISFRKVRRELDERMVPLMALLTALFFAAQMMNYPVIGGTTAHLLGGPSLGILLGPSTGLTSMTIILVLQCLLFGDGGITALGANVLNMGVAGVIIPYVLFVLIVRATKGKQLFIGAFIGGLVGDVLAAVLAGLELGLSVPTFIYGVSIAVPAMAIHHSIIGVAEGFVTAALLRLLITSRPEVLSLSPTFKSLSLDLKISHGGGLKIEKS
ncbi:MAG: energy-coupling factor ABC transporter permease [Candidatus Methanomethyliaceae archaeon]|nr:energy-coupling factor ABC transporter permease [Candidatus Methanomethyliaceae archaeon]